MLPVLPVMDLRVKAIKNLERRVWQVSMPGISNVSYVTGVMVSVEHIPKIFSAYKCARWL